MPTNQVQLRRDTATNLNAATPVAGELGYDTTNKRFVIGDGSTAGGIKIPNYLDLRVQSFSYSTVGGTANAITLTNSPAVISYVAPLKLTFKATGTNSSAVTANVDGLGTKNIYKLSGTSLIALTGNEIVSGAIYDITYDGTQFQLTNSGGGALTVVEQIFTSSGTYTPTANMKYCHIIAGGGGGGGGGSNGSYTASKGGGAGAICRGLYSAATIGASQSITIGAAGAGGGAGSNGVTGGATQVGGLITANGGIFGIANNTVPASGSAGGSAGGGTFSTIGRKSDPVYVANWGGKGADSDFGQGGDISTASTGNAATGYSAGGGGAGSSGSYSGGAGAAGFVYILEYI